MEAVEAHGAEWKPWRGHTQAGAQVPPGWGPAAAAPGGPACRAAVTGSQADQ